jgi:ethanolamine ammonia-lyase small subunit
MKTVPDPHNAAHLQQIVRNTPARIGVWRTGSRPLTNTWLKFRADHAMARDAVHSELSEEFLDAFAQANGYPIISTLVSSRKDFVLFPPRGKRTSVETIEMLQCTCRQDCDVQPVISDGLSAKAVEANVPDLLAMLKVGFAQEGITMGTPIVVRYGRVAIGDQLGEALRARVALNLIGERPGLSTDKSLSAYITYNPGESTISSDRTVVSNIHTAGTPAVEAGAYIVSLVKRILAEKVSGVRLQQLG